MLADRSDKITGVWYPSAFLSLFSQLPIPWQPLFWECIRYLILTRFPICIRLLRPKLHRRSWKKIGSTARYEIERLLDCKVNLKLWVKVQKNWRDSDYMMKNFGYREDDMS